MSFTLFDTAKAVLGDRGIGLEQRRDPCVCSVAVSYCGVCRAWDKLHGTGKRGPSGKNTATLVQLGAHGKPYYTRWSAKAIRRVHELRTKGYTREGIAEKLDLKFSDVRTMFRLRIVKEESSSDTQG